MRMPREVNILTNEVTLLINGTIDITLGRRTHQCRDEKRHTARHYVEESMISCNSPYEDLCAGRSTEETWVRPAEVVHLLDKPSLAKDLMRGQKYQFHEDYDQRTWGKDIRHR